MVLIHEETSWQAVRVAAYLKFLTTELQQNDHPMNIPEAAIGRTACMIRNVSHVNLHTDKPT